VPDLTYESAITKNYSPTPGAELTLRDESHMAKIVVRAAEGTAAEANLSGVQFGHNTSNGDLIIAGTRPHEWMVLGGTSAVSARVGEIPTDGHASIVDWTHGRAAFRLTGATAAGALEKVCSIDWSDNMTPDGAVVSASVAGAGCDIVRNDASGSPSYLILCDRSFGQYLFDALLDACDEFGVSSETRTE